MKLNRRAGFVLGGVLAAATVMTTVGVPISAQATGSEVVAAASASAETVTGDFYVAPDGDDLDPGTEAAPFLTLERAQTAVRAAIAGGMTDDVVVVLRGGVYRPSSTLVFTPADSGRDGHRVLWRNYPGERPVISGSMPVTGWEPWGANGIYRASVGLGADPVYGPDLLADGGFEESGLGWELVYPGGTANNVGNLLEVSSDEAAEGVASAHIVKIAGQADAAFTQTVEVDPAALYQVDLKALLLSGAMAYRLTQLNAAGQVLGFTNITLGTEYDNWVDLTSTIGPASTAPTVTWLNGVTQLRVELETRLEPGSTYRAAAGEAYYDDVSVARILNPDGYVGPDFHTVYDGEERVVVARTPNVDDRGRNQYFLIPEGIPVADRFHYVGDDVPMVDDPSGLQTSLFPNANWNGGLYDVKDVDYDAGIVTLDTPIYLSSIVRETRYFLQNDLSLLDAAGEYYFDRDEGYLYYKPSGAIADAAVEVPTLTRVIEVRGDSPTTLARDITFSGLTVMNSDAPEEIYRVPNNYVATETNPDPATVFVKDAEGIVFDGGRILNSGVNGISFNGTAIGSAIRNSEIANTGMAGVRIAGPVYTSSYVSRDNDISNNDIHDSGQLAVHDAPGIFVSDTGDLTVSHNRVAHTARGGISVNGNPPPIGREIDGILVTAENQADFVHTLNVSVDHNDISDATSDCSDCAPIYLWGINGGGMEVVHNWVHHSGFRAWPGLNHGVGGVYLDGSDLNSDVLVADNLFSNLQKAEDGFDGWIDTMFVSKARARFDNNVLVDCPNTLGVFSNGTDISITHNVVQNCGRNAYVSDGGAAVAIGDADLNLFLAEDGVPEVEGVVGAADLNEWIAQGQFDQQSLIADADFVEDGMHPYQMAFDSPARSLDIHDIDTASIGLAADHPFTRGQPMSQIALGTDPSAGDGAVRVGVGESVALTVLARDADGFVVDPDSLEYGSDTPSVATVSASGVVTGAGAGLAEITATATRDGVTLVRHASVLVDFDTALRREVLPGHPVDVLPELLARLGVDPGSAEVGYCDVDDSIVTVDSDAGACTAPSPATRLELTGVEFGSTAIDVRVREGDDVIRLLLLVEVVQDRLASVSVDLPERVSAGTSAPLDLSASLLSGADLDLSAAEVEYLSSDAGVATVSADGVVSVLTVGTVTVTARVTYDGVSVDGTTTIRNRDARARTDGGDYDAKSYPVLDLNGTQIKNTGLGGWAEYRNVDFGTGVDRVDVEIGVNANNAGRAVEFRLDAADGPLIGTLTVANTGTFNVYTTQSTEIGGVRGVHDLYLVFPGTGITAGNLRAFTFVGGVLDHVAPVISTDLEDGQFVAGTQDVRVTVVEENPLAYHAQLYTRDGVAVPGIAAYAYKPQSGELVIPEIDWDELPDGSYYLQMTARDQADNVSTSRVVLRRDSSRPSR